MLSWQYPRIVFPLSFLSSHPSRVFFYYYYFRYFRLFRCGSDLCTRAHQFFLNETKTMYPTLDRVKKKPVYPD